MTGARCFVTENSKKSLAVGHGQEYCKIYMTMNVKFCDNYHGKKYRITDTE